MYKKFVEKNKKWSFWSIAKKVFLRYNRNNNKICLGIKIQNGGTYEKIRSIRRESSGGSR